MLPVPAPWPFFFKNTFILISFPFLFFLLLVGVCDSQLKTRWNPRTRMLTRMLKVTMLKYRLSTKDKLPAASATAELLQKTRRLQCKPPNEYHLVWSLPHQRWHCSLPASLRSLTLSLLKDDPSAERAHPLIASRHCPPLAASATAGLFQKTQRLQCKPPGDYHLVPSLPHPR